jgi:hypothetical protein
MRLKKTQTASIGIAIAIAGPMLPAAAQQLQLNPKLLALTPAACAQGMTANPGMVGKTTAYFCRSAAALCLQGWVVGNVHVENNTFVYGCTPSSQIPR